VVAYLLPVAGGGVPVGFLPPSGALRSILREAPEGGDLCKAFAASNWDEKLSLASLPEPQPIAVSPKITTMHAGTRDFTDLWPR